MPCIWAQGASLCPALPGLSPCCICRCHVYTDVGTSPRRDGPPGLSGQVRVETGSAAGAQWQQEARKECLLLEEGGWGGEMKQAIRRWDVWRGQCRGWWRGRCHTGPGTRTLLSVLCEQEETSGRFSFYSNIQSDSSSWRTWETLTETPSTDDRDGRRLWICSAVSARPWRSMLAFLSVLWPPQGCSVQTGFRARVLVNAVISAKAFSAFNIVKRIRISKNLATHPILF